MDCAAHVQKPLIMASLAVKVLVLLLGVTFIFEIGAARRKRREIQEDITVSVPVTVSSSPPTTLNLTTTTEINNVTNIGNDTTERNYSFINFN